MIYTFDIIPIAAPRMSQRDKWKNTRTAQAERYLVYKRDLQILQLHIKFEPSYSMRMKFFIPGVNKVAIATPFCTPHQQKPDTDNLVKGFLDSVMENDATVYHVDAYKYWTDEKQGRIEVEHL